MKAKLTLLEGGMISPINDKPKRFVSAYVTDTRLMGVLAIYAHWEISEGLCHELHQFFYIDCEESGLETYRSFRGELRKEIIAAEQELIGGLGAKKIPLSEKGFRWLLQHWKEFNEKRSLPLPKNREEYSFVFEKEVLLPHEEREAFLRSLCVEIKSDYQLINYFMMRCFGRDYEGARCLTPTAGSGTLDADFPLDIYDVYVGATFWRNVIDKEKSYGDGSISYFCESLVEMRGKYETVVSRVVVKDLQVIGFEHCSGFSLSNEEAAMVLQKPEFVSVYEVLADDELLEENLGEFTLGLNTIMSVHENGRMFMAYKESNEHVNERKFMLSNDLRGVYFLTYYGQLLVMSNSERGASALEAKLAGSPLAKYMEMTSRYEFMTPILFEYIKSDFEDFDDFVETFRG